MEPATCYKVSDDIAAVATDNENTTVQQEDKGDDVEPAASTSLMSFRDLVPLQHKERPANAKKRRVCGMYYKLAIQTPSGGVAAFTFNIQTRG